MEKYGTETRLMNNQQYSVVFTVKGEATTVSFTSEYNPLYSTVKLIRNDFKQLFAGYTDDEINRFIHDNSKLAIEIANPEINTNEEIPYYVKQYVRYKTELDMLTDILISLNTRGGLEEKLLGDMKITKEVQTPRDLRPLIDLIENRLAPWEMQLVGMKGRPTSAIRAGTTAEFPLTGRNSF